MKKFTFALFAGVTIFSIACNSSHDHEATKIAGMQDTVIKKDFSNVVFASARDTTCNMLLSEGVGDTLHLEGKVYGFCSTECKDAFIAKLIK